MIFSSLLFIYGFLPISLFLYYIAPKKYRNSVMLLLSIVYCGMIGLKYLVFLLIFAFWNFFASLLVEKLKRRRAVSVIPLVIGITGDIASMLLFRTDLFSSIKEKFGFFAVGISFLTLSAIGSLIEIYCGKSEEKLSLSKFMLYMLFFPKLIMGPPISFRSFSKIAGRRRETLEDLGAGLIVFIKGLAKRVIFAESLNALYFSVRSIGIEELSAVNALLGLISYSLCLYFTLSGYADMGVGAARCFGFRLPRSFNYPSLSMGINDFCRRWHKPVVKWFEKNLYNPLSSCFSGIQLKKILRILTWGVIGFWYGASLNSFIWGLLIGLAAVVERSAAGKNTLKATSIIYTFIVILICSTLLVCETLPEAFSYLIALIGGNNNIADPSAFYLLKAYALILIAGIYISSDMFRNIAYRSSVKLIKIISQAVVPIFSLLMLAVCTALIAHGGSVEMLLIQL